MESKSSRPFRPWERRLGDLWLLLERCHTTYMEPELFRLSTNQFLQTSRTVTFIVQKHKDAIPNFESWYQPLIAAWASDPVMIWAKNSRNTIEKEGDLDLHSSLELTLFASYFVENDLKLTTGRSELLKAGAKRLVRFAQKNVPSNSIDSTAIKIERSWVANTLPSWELLRAFSYIYSMLYQACKSLAEHIGEGIHSSISCPTTLLGERERARRVQYLKLSDLRTHHRHMVRVTPDSEFKPPAQFELEGCGLREDFSLARSPDQMFRVLSRMAVLNFDCYGNHVPMFFLYDHDMRCVDALSAAFADQVDKYIFWRDLADRVVLNKVAAVAAIGEMWVRDLNGYYSMPMRKLPIIGERLFVNMLDSTGSFRSSNWSIRRSGEGEKPVLERIDDSDERKEQIPFVYAPIFHAFGLAYPKHFEQKPALPAYMQRRKDWERQALDGAAQRRAEGKE